MCNIDEIISKYDGITNTHQVNELIKFDVSELYKKIIAIETDIELLKNKQRRGLEEIACIFIDYLNFINTKDASTLKQIEYDNLLSVKFGHVAKSYRIAKRQTKTNIISIQNTLDLIKKYNEFINKVDNLIKNKDYINAKQLLYSNLVFYKEELSNFIGNKITQINIINILNAKVTKYIDILKRH